MLAATSNQLLSAKSFNGLRATNALQSILMRDFVVDCTSVHGVSTGCIHLHSF